MYNYWRGCAENGGNKYLASNQAVGGSNPSGCANLIKHLRHFRKFESSNKNTNIKVVIDGCRAIVGSVFKSDRFAYRPVRG